MTLGKDVRRFLKALNNDYFDVEDEKNLKMIHKKLTNKSLLRTENDTINELIQENTTPHMALFWSLILGYDDIASKIIINGINLNEADSNGATALHYFIKNYDKFDPAKDFMGNNPLLSLLISNEANPNARDNAGKTPLHYAAILKIWDLYELLVSYGADETLRDKDLMSPQNYKGLPYNPKESKIEIYELYPELKLSKAKVKAKLKAKPIIYEPYLPVITDESKDISTGESNDLENINSAEITNTDISNDDLIPNEVVKEIKSEQDELNELIIKITTAYNKKDFELLETLHAGSNKLKNEDELKIILNEFLEDALNKDSAFIFQKIYPLCSNLNISKASIKQKSVELIASSRNKIITHILNNDGLVEVLNLNHKEICKLAIENNNFELLKLIFKSEFPNKKKLFIEGNNINMEFVKLAEAAGNKEISNISFEFLLLNNKKLFNNTNLLNNYIDEEKFGLCEILIKSGFGLNKLSHAKSAVEKLLLKGQRDLCQYIIQNRLAAIEDKNLYKILNLLAENDDLEFFGLILENSSQKRLNKIKNYVDKDGNTFLHKAILANNINLAKILIAKNFNLNFKNKDDNEALYLIANSNLDEIFNLIKIIDFKDITLSDNICKYVDILINLINKDKEDDKFEKIEVLIKYMPDLVNNYSSKKQLALHNAIILNKPKITQLLLDNEAGIFLANPSKQNALNISNKFNNLAIKKVIYYHIVNNSHKYFNKDHYIKYDDFIPQEIKEFYEDAGLEEILSKNYNYIDSKKYEQINSKYINYYYSNLNLMIILPIIKNNHEKLKFLIDKGANIYMPIKILGKINTYSTPLKISLVEDRIRSQNAKFKSVDFKSLAATILGVKIKNNEHYLSELLHHAIYNEDDHLFREILSCSDISTSKLVLDHIYDGQSLIYLAVMKNNYEYTKLLLIKNVNININPRHINEMFISSVEKNDNYKMLNLLLKSGLILEAETKKEIIKISSVKDNKQIYYYLIATDIISNDTEIIPKNLKSQFVLAKQIKNYLNKNENKNIKEIIKNFNKNFEDNFNLTNLVIKFNHKINGFNENYNEKMNELLSSLNVLYKTKDKLDFFTLNISDKLRYDIVNHKANINNNLSYISNYLYHLCEALGVNFKNIYNFFNLTPIELNSINSYFEMMFNEMEKLENLKEIVNYANNDVVLGNFECLLMYLKFDLKKQYKNNYSLHKAPEDGYNFFHVLNKFTKPYYKFFNEEITDKIKAFITNVNAVNLIKPIKLDELVLDKFHNKHEQEQGRIEEEVQKDYMKLLDKIPDNCPPSPHSTEKSLNNDKEAQKDTKHVVEFLKAINNNTNFDVQHVNQSYFNESTKLDKLCDLINGLASAKKAHSNNDKASNSAPPLSVIALHDANDNEMDLTGDDTTLTDI